MFGKKNNDFFIFYIIVYVFFFFIFKCYSFIEYIDFIEYIVYLINIQRCCVLFYFILCNIVILFVLDKGFFDIEWFFMVKIIYILYFVYYIYDFQFFNLD